MENNYEFENEQQFIDSSYGDCEIKEIDESNLQTSNIENCNNNGCGFNIDGECMAIDTTCFGFMEVEEVVCED